MNAEHGADDRIDIVYIVAERKLPSHWEGRGEGGGKITA